MFRPWTVDILEECSGRWRVVVDPGVERFFERKGFLEEWRRHVEELRESLNRDPRRPLELLDPTEHPVLGRVTLPGLGVLKVRRYRVYLRGQAFRLAFTLYRLHGREGHVCVVHFIYAVKKKERTHRDLRRRYGG